MPRIMKITTAMIFNRLFSGALRCVSVARSRKRRQDEREGVGELAVVLDAEEVGGGDEEDEAERGEPDEVVRPPPEKELSRGCEKETVRQGCRRDFTRFRNDVVDDVLRSPATVQA